MQTSKYNDVSGPHRKALSKPWQRLAGPCDAKALLYHGQISAALSAAAFPLRLVWNQSMWDKLLTALNAGDPIGPPDYPGCQEDVTLAAKRWLSGGETALVVGSVSPWLEALLQQAGCARTVTLDICKIQSEVAALHTVTYSQWIDNFTPVDVVASFSTVEHFGLGRYGDQRSRDADIRWMREFAGPMLRPDGIQMIAVPVAKSSMRNDAHRIYGPGRMRRLLETWQLIEVIFQGKVLDHIPFMEPYPGEDWQKQPLLVLKRVSQ